MASIRRLIWHAERSGIDVPKRERIDCVYEAYRPDPLMGRSFPLEDTVATEVAAAEHAVVRLNERATLVDTEALARILLRAESVASSRMEGLYANARRILAADIAEKSGAAIADVAAVEILGNIKAAASALERVGPGYRLTLEDLLAAHRELLRATPQAWHAGTFRTKQNWIGGSAYNPRHADFVPPPPEDLPALLEDFRAFCNADELPPIVQAAIAHAQFETLHPFADGNGRIGRILIHLILKRRGLAPRIVPPISLILATRAAAYVAGLQATRYRGEATSEAARKGINAWIAEFAFACRRAVADVDLYEGEIGRLIDAWRERLGPMRADAAALALLRALPAMPVLTVKIAAETASCSVRVANAAIERLVRAGILRERHAKRRNRVFEAREVLDSFTALECRLASPAGDTRIEPPARAAPRRPR